MKINLLEILYAVSFGMDATEIEYLQKSGRSGSGAISAPAYNEHSVEYITTGHSKRIAALSLITGKALGLTPEELHDLAAYSILHDNAITEFIQEENEYKKYNEGRPYVENAYVVRHCTIGESNSMLIFSTFRSNNRDVILYHHENADGTGPFEKTADKTPIKSQIIHLADCIDSYCDLTINSVENYKEICFYVRNNKNTLFGAEVADAFLSVFTPKILNSISFSNINKFLDSQTKKYEANFSSKDVRRLAELLAKIVDYKTHYTCRHCLGVAITADTMAKHYKFSEEKRTRFFLAGALHDIGKLFIDMEILQKPGKLNDEEFEKMKNHAYYTYEVLKDLKGMEDITVWASHHHEKLDGSGYPFGLTGDKLSKEERLMTCADIYQALTEKRPYKDGLTHEQCMVIMYNMVSSGELDGEIVSDMEMVYSRKRGFQEIHLS